MFSHIFDWEKLNSFFTGIFEFIILNLMFLLFNIPILIFIFGIGIQHTSEFLPVVLGASVLLGPALSAMFYCMERRMRDKGIFPIKDFWRGYKKNFLPSVLAALVQCGLIFILETNISFFKENEMLQPFAAVFMVMMALLILSIPSTYLLISRFRMNPMELMRGTLALTIGKPGLTLGNAAAFLAVLVFFEISAGTAILCISSIYGFLVVFMNRKVLDSLIVSKEPEKAQCPE